MIGQVSSKRDSSKHRVCAFLDTVRTRASSNPTASVASIPLRTVNVAPCASRKMRQDFLSQVLEVEGDAVGAEGLDPVAGLNAGRSTTPTVGAALSGGDRVACSVGPLG